MCTLVYTVCAEDGLHIKPSISWRCCLCYLLWNSMWRTYDAASETNKSMLQRLQTRAARLISGTVPRLSGTMVFKCRNGLAAPYLIDSFNANTFNHSYSTRNSSKLRIPIARTGYYHISILISGCNAWNNLPIRKSVSLNCFKFNMFKYILAKIQF